MIFKVLDAHFKEKNKTNNYVEGVKAEYARTGIVSSADLRRLHWYYNRAIHAQHCPCGKA